MEKNDYGYVVSKLRKSKQEGVNRKVGQLDKMLDTLKQAENEISERAKELGMSDKEEFLNSEEAKTMRNAKAIISMDELGGIIAKTVTSITFDAVTQKELNISEEVLSLVTTAFILLSGKVVGEVFSEKNNYVIKE